MIAGRMKYMLKVYQPSNSVGSFGETTSVWTQVATIHAERVKISGRRAVIDNEIFADYAVEYNIRSAHAVKENWRVEEVGGYMYTVKNVIPNKYVGMLTLVCDRINE